MPARDENEERLLAELKAIELWDNDYHSKRVHDRFDQESYGLRQERRKEIMQAVAELWQAKRSPLRNAG